MKWNDFLNPRSMLTPGVAGSLVMVIANTLWVEFMVPQKYSALVLSFILIVPILARFSASFFENVIYFLFNGLIIFSLSVNSNFAGMKIQEISNTYSQNLVSQQSTPSSNANLASDKKINMLQLSSNDNPSIVATLAANQQPVNEQNPVNTSTPTEQQPVPKEKNKKDEKQTSKHQRGFFTKWF